jgi:maltose O-acetyltransferase
MLKKLFRNIYIFYKRKQQKLSLITIIAPTHIHYSSTFRFHRGIKIGRYCRIGHECHLDGEGGITIGDGTILAPRVTILSSSHSYKNSPLLPYGLEDEKLPVVIGKGCWIGWGAMIRPGINIGDGAVVAMGSVVTKNISTGEVVGGNPARVIKERDGDLHVSTMVENERYFLKEVHEKNLIREGRKTDTKNNLIK